MDVYARRPQVQERLTTQIADSLMRILEPRGVIVVVECEHMCMSMRGVRKPGAKTITSAVRGQLRDRGDPRRGDEPDHGALSRRGGYCATWWLSCSRATGSSRFQVVKLWPPLGRMIEETRIGGRTARMKSRVAW